MVDRSTPYEEAPGVPIVYFDVAAAFGVLGGAVQIELCHRVLTPVSGTDDVTAKMAPTGRLRCSPIAAKTLMDALAQALAMLEQPQQPAAAASKLN